MTSIAAVNSALKSGQARLAGLYPLADGAGVVVLREERMSDVGAREALLDESFGPARFGKTSERLREGRLPAEGLALVAYVGGRLAGTVRLWHVDAGGVPALLLGPLAVSSEHRSLGIGGLLMREAIVRAGQRGHGAILLVGDEAYYRKFGFRPEATRALDLPGPVERARFLALELSEGALAEARGGVVATGVPAGKRLQRRVSGERRAA